MKSERWSLNVSNGHERIAIVHNWKKGKKAKAGETQIRCVPQIRYQLGNHLGSASLELTEHADIISYEEYLPYGGTAFIAGKDKTEVKRKTYRYSGKERDDSTGLYYYGARYYAPWLGRWLNPDPAGTIDGLNLYAFVKGNPATFEDNKGLTPTLAPIDNPPRVSPADLMPSPPIVPRRLGMNLGGKRNKKTKVIDKRLVKKAEREKPQRMFARRAVAAPQASTLHEMLSVYTVLRRTQIESKPIEFAKNELKVITGYKGQLEKVVHEIDYGKVISLPGKGSPKEVPTGPEAVIENVVTQTKQLLPGNDNENLPESFAVAKHLLKANYEAIDKME